MGVIMIIGCTYFLQIASAEKASQRRYPFPERSRSEISIEKVEVRKENIENREEKKRNALHAERQRQNAKKISV
jgi:hypothetical protein